MVEYRLTPGTHTYHREPPTPWQRGANLRHSARRCAQGVHSPELRAFLGSVRR